MKIAILYICTGKYAIFWKDFYRSCEAHFLPEATREYFVFTDAAELDGEKENPRIHKIYQERMGWPNDTLLRFQLFASIDERLQDFNYIFFFNANAQFLRRIGADEVLPSSSEQLVAVKHPGYFDEKPRRFTYESKQRKSTAYIPKGEGQHYFAGGVNGGIATAYRELIATLHQNITRDLQNGIVAVWHDESHLNHYLLKCNPKILSPSFVYPEGWQLPFEPVVLIRDKAKLGGHDFLRNVQTRKPLRKKLAAFVKKLMRK